LSQGDVVLEALLDEVQNLKNELSRIWGKINSLQTKLAEIDSHQRDTMAKTEKETPRNVE